MKQFISKAQNFGKKAAEMRQAVQNLPQQAAKIREAVNMTGGELHQLRADVQASINALKAESEDDLLNTMREINDHAVVFEEAGYELTGMDLDLALNRRLAVHLAKFEDVQESTLRSLHSRQTCESIRSILVAIIKAEETAANVELNYLQHAGVVVHVGAIPTIRMSWRVQEETVEPTPVPAQAIAAPSLASTPGLGSMFEPRPFPTAGVRVASTPVAAAPSSVVSAPTAVETASSSWSQSALERFKKMPGASKYGR